ncbi:hypothetical protein BKA56DRAFT_611356 [Ilyonectria sp. MPI-CAGE-AT-0026]|nr:hypothetical protein BKA56DRAFT_611356 [Ilyonectria sp. MPI-CAGE-AT-0026]
MSTSESSANSPSVNGGKARRIWTPAEDAVLKALVGHYGDARGQDGSWKEIAASLHNRSPKDCRKRWFHSLDPSLRKGRWTAQEDEILLGAYARLGPSWHEIASLIPGRKDDQCSKRYNDILNPLARDRLIDWTPHEDDLLRQGVCALGHRWSAISSRIPGRPPLTCRNRWRTLSRKSQLRRSIPKDTLSSIPSQMSASEPSTSPGSRNTALAPESLNGDGPDKLGLDTLSCGLLGGDIGDRGQGSASFLDPALYNSFSDSAHQSGIELQIANADTPPSPMVLDGIALNTPGHTASISRHDWSQLARSPHANPQPRPLNTMAARSYLSEPASWSPISSTDYDAAAPTAPVGQPNNLWPSTASLSEDPQLWGLLEDDFTPAPRTDSSRFTGQPQQVIHVHHHYHYHIMKGDPRHHVEGSGKESIPEPTLRNTGSTYE